jgi:hypothetical protein
LLVWNHGILNDFPETVGNVMIPTDELHYFSEQLKPADVCLETGIVENPWKLFMKKNSGSCG